MLDGSQHPGQAAHGGTGKPAWSQIATRLKPAEVIRLCMGGWNGTHLPLPSQRSSSASATVGSVIQTRIVHCLCAKGLCCRDFQGTMNSCHPASQSASKQ